MTKPLMAIFNRNDKAGNKCNRCGITQLEREKLPPMRTGIDHPEHAWTKSFYLQNCSWIKNDTYEAIVWCPECHKEHQLEDTFAAMDRYAEKHGEAKLAEICGIGEHVNGNKNTK